MRPMGRMGLLRVCPIRPIGPILPIILLSLTLLTSCDRRSPQDGGGEVKVLTATTFDAAIAKGVVLVDFWGDWCEPCKEQSTIVAEMAAEMGGKGGVTFANLDLGFEEARKKIEHLNIEYVPTLIIFKKGTPFKTFEGLTSKEILVEAINEAKATTK